MGFSNHKSSGYTEKKRGRAYFFKNESVFLRLISQKHTTHLDTTTMAVTKLLRKSKRNVMIPQNKQVLMKQRSWKPEIKRVDVEAIKAEFAAKA